MAMALCYPNLARTASVTGGSWLASLPVLNVRTQYLTEVARSTDHATSSTIIRHDLGSSKAIQAFALAYVYATDTCLWRIKVGTSAGAGDVLTTSWLNLWERGLETSLTAIGAQDTSAYYLRRFHPVYVHSTMLNARYVTIEIDDSAGAYSYVDVGRTFISGGYFPAVNASYGLKDSWTDLSTKTRAESGTQWATVRRRIRSTSFVLEQRTLADAEILHDLQRFVGTVEDVLYVPDISDMRYSQRYGFIGNLQELSPIEYPFFNRRSVPFAIEEIA